jgi:hypothetical protein
MTLYQFNALDKTQQAEIVWNGAHIGNRRDEEYEILLYQIDSFYVEVYYHPDHNVISKMRSFPSTDQLAPYLQQIDIKKMF